MLVGAPVWVSVSVYVSMVFLRTAVSSGVASVPFTW